MAGHSKWSTIKRKKEKTDAQKAKIFTKITREIIVATKTGGGDQEANFKLKMAIQKAKEVNMPNDNIARAIKRGLGASESEQYEEIIYEGYGPAGVAFFVEALSDNRNRTASEIRYIFSRNGGNLGETGCVSWLFEPKSQIQILKNKAKISEEDLFELAIEAGADDLEQEDEYYVITGAPANLDSIRRKIEEQVPVERAELTYIPQNTVTVTGEDAQAVVRLFEALEEHDDVQNVYANFEIDEEELKTM
ncbi:MAG TPA: YebC/PmpR family DNA-binding transcriptional regulator [Bacillota bacterium]